MENEIEKYFKNNKIILVIVFIFIASVGYKWISSNIQENKEKAIIDYRDQVEQSQKNQDFDRGQELIDQNLIKEQEIEAKLNSCLKTAKTQARNTAEIFDPLGRCFNVGNYDTEIYNECVENGGQGREVCILGNIDQRTSCFELVNSKQNEILEELKQDENNCYTRFK